MAHAWNACWVNSPQGFESPILRQFSPKKRGSFFGVDVKPLILTLGNVPVEQFSVEEAQKCFRNINRISPIKKLLFRGIVNKTILLSKTLHLLEICLLFLQLKQDKSFCKEYQDIKVIKMYNEKDQR